MIQKRPKLVLEPDQIEQRAPGLELHEEVQIAVGALLAAGDGTEHRYGTPTMDRCDRPNLAPSRFNECTERKQRGVTHGARLRVGGRMNRVFGGDEIRPADDRWIINRRPSETD